MTKTRNKHFSGDGNGGLYISKSFFALIAIALTVIGMLGGFAGRALAFQERITTMENRVDQCCDGVEQVVQNKQDIAVLTTKLDNIDKNVEKILVKVG